MVNACQGPSEYILASAVLGAEVMVSISGDLVKPKLVFICLDDTLPQLLARNPMSMSGVSFASLYLLESPKLSLEFLERQARFLALELIPSLKSHWIDLDLSYVLSGRQFNAVLSVYTAAKYAAIFKAALAISGSFWWKPDHDPSWEWLGRWLRASGAKPEKIFLICSVHDASDRPQGVPSTLISNQHLKETLQAQLCKVELITSLRSEFSGDFFEEFLIALDWL